MPLHAQINALCQQFATQLAHALQGVPLDELAEALALDGAPRASRPAPARTPRAPKATQVEASTSRGRVASRERTEDVADAIRQALSATPEGVLSEELRASLDLSKKRFSRAIESLRASGAVRKEGTLRSTTYFLA